MDPLTFLNVLGCPSLSKCHLLMDRFPPEQLLLFFQEFHSFYLFVCFAFMVNRPLWNGSFHSVRQRLADPASPATRGCCPVGLVPIHHIHLGIPGSRFKNTVWPVAGTQLKEMNKWWINREFGPSELGLGISRTEESLCQPSNGVTNKNTSAMCPAVCYCLLVHCVMGESLQLGAWAPADGGMSSSAPLRGSPPPPVITG